MQLLKKSRKPHFQNRWLPVHLQQDVNVSLLKKTPKQPNPLPKKAPPHNPALPQNGRVLK